MSRWVGGVDGYTRKTTGTASLPAAAKDDTRLLAVDTEGKGVRGRV